VPSRSHSAGPPFEPFLRDDGLDFRCWAISWRGWSILALEGEFDSAHALEARAALLDLPALRCGRLALDLSRLSFMDSTGIRLVLQAMSYAEGLSADFALIRGPHNVQRVLELVGLTEQLRIVEDPGCLG
jgi:anti-sigma B factor antagonist